MHKILWRLTAASTGVLAAFALCAVPAGASSSRVHHGPERTPVQVADQVARTNQHADSSATSKQFLPVNANVPVQILSLGTNGGDTKQSNSSTATSTARNEAWTDQSVAQHQSAPQGDQPEGHDGWKPEGPKGDQPEGHDGHSCDDRDRDGRDGWKPDRPVDRGGRPEVRPGPGPAFQGAEQHASTNQSADSSATSKQFLPVNANVPVQILSLGSNGGDTQQSNSSTATSHATNDAGTVQTIGQAQGGLAGLGGLVG